MRLPSRVSVVGSLLAAAYLLIHAPASAAPVSVRTLAAEEAKMATIAFRMAVANSQACSRPEMMTGLILHDLTQYEPAQRPAVSRAFALNSGFGVLELVPGSAATRAGLKIDDEIISVGNVSVEDPARVARSNKSFHRMEEMSARLQSGLRSGPVPLLIRRKGQLHRVDLKGEPGCGGHLSLSNSSVRNAWADGKHIIVTTGMTKFARSNDEIAFIIAHEMAHNILGHVHGQNETRGIFGIGSSRSKSIEIDADSYAVQLMSKAGYQPDAGVSFLKHSQRRLWWTLSLGHPSFGRRVQSVLTAISSLKAPLAQSRTEGFARAISRAPEKPHTDSDTNAHTGIMAKLNRPSLRHY